VQDSAKVRVRGSLCSSLGEELQKAALAGEGLVIRPTCMVADYLAAGRPVNVLPETPPLGLDVDANYPPRRGNLPKRVRAFVDFLCDWARSPPDWATPAQPTRAASMTRIDATYSASDHRRLAKLRLTV